MNIALNTLAVAVKAPVNIACFYRESFWEIVCDVCFTENVYHSGIFSG